jgi:hypothetical protein
MKAPAQKAPIQSHKHIAKSGIDLIDERTAAFERCLSLDSVSTIAVHPGRIRVWPYVVVKLQ